MIMPYNGTMIVLIKGIEYKVKLLSKTQYIKLMKDTSLAHLNREDRTLMFRKDHIKKNIVIHEVVHAFINPLHLGSCNELTLEDFEEIICEMLEDHLLDINKVSNTILSFLKS